MKPANVLLALVLAVAAIGIALKLTGALDKLTETRTVDAPTAAESGPLPKIVIDESTHNFGIMGVHAVKSHVYSLTNEGVGELILTHGDATCKCTSFSIGDQKQTDKEPVSVPPGESIDITLEWHPTDPSLEFRQSAKVHTNDPRMTTLELEIVGSVVPQVMALPEGVWNLGVITGEEEQVVMNGIVYSLLEEFEFATITSDNPHLTIETEPLTDESLEENGAKGGYKVQVTVDKDLPAGPFTALLNYEVSNDPGAKYTTRISANKTGPVQIVPNFGVMWSVDQGLIDIGEVSGEKGRTFSVNLFIHGDSETLELTKITDVTAHPEFLKATVERDKRFKKGTGKQRYKIECEIPAGSERGTWVSPDFGSIVIKTTHPRIPELRLNVSMIIL